MKKLLFAILLLVGVSAQAQITVNGNSFVINPADTNVEEIIISERLSKDTMIMFKIPSTNSGTVKINMLSSDMTNADAEAATAEDRIIPPLTIKGQRFWIQFSNAADTVTIYW